MSYKTSGRAVALTSIAGIRRSEALGRRSFRTEFRAALSFILTVASANPALAQEDVKGDLARSAWVAAQLHKIQDDPRIFLEMRASLTTDVFVDRLHLINDRYKPRLGDAIRIATEKTWRGIKSDEFSLAVDLIGDAGRAGGGTAGGAIVGTAATISKLKDYGIRVEKISEKWSKENAGRLLPLIRNDAEIILTEYYNRSVQLKTRSKGSVITPDFLSRDQSIAKSMG